MSIYEQRVRGKPINPGLALYNFWHSVLLGVHGATRNAANRLVGSTHLGSDRNWTISFTNSGSPDKPHISYGGTFTLTELGEFQINMPHGYHQRDIVARNTFLQWSTFRGYNWLIQTGKPDTSWAARYGSLSNWEQPVPYVSERIMGSRQWGNRPWMKPVWDDEHGWVIGWSRSGLTPRYNGPLITEDDFNRFLALRERRYYLKERAFKIASGEWLQEGSRVVTTQVRAERREKAVQALLPHMTVSQPAPTNPLRRERED